MTLYIRLSAINYSVAQAVNTLGTLVVPQVIITLVSHLSPNLLLKLKNSILYTRVYLSP